jgi:hypothetical protein
MWIFIVIIAIIVLAGLFNPWTGLFGNTFYSPKRKKEEIRQPEPKHQSFKLTKED